MQRVLLVLIILVATLTWWFWGRTLEPVRVIRHQLAAIKQAEYDVAYAFLAAETRRKLPPEEFQDVVRRSRAVRQTWDSTFLSRRIRDQTATIQGHLTGKDGHTYEVGYTLIKQNGEWKIRDFRW